MNADDKQTFTTLSWVKQDLDETFGQAREALEAYVEDPEDTQQLHECTRRLHQLHGTLRMVEMYGAAMVVDEMETLAQAVVEDQVDDQDSAYSALMSGMVQIPDYLERIQSGHRDIPVVLLPLLNDLRAASGQAKASEAVLFAPNLNAPLPADAPGSDIPLPRDEQQQRVRQLRTRFQVPLLAWMRKPDDTSRLVAMRDILDQAGATCQSVTGRRLWWIAGGVLEGLEQHALDDQSRDVRPLIGRVDRAMKQLIDAGELALGQGVSEDLARQMLYYVAVADGDTERLRQLRRVYALDDAIPDEKELEHARGAVSGRNRTLLDTVSGAIKEDLLKVKDALDIFLRKADADVADLEPQVEVLDRVSDTLGMLGLPMPSRVVDEQHELMREMVAGSHPHNESALLDIAGALLYVESSLDDHIENLGDQAVAGSEADAGEMPLSAEARRVQGALMTEAEGNLTKVKQDITAFIETPWDHREVARIPTLLAEIGGAMRMVELQRPADLLDGISCFVHNELIVDRHIPTAEQMEKLADALASFEYFLESSREHRSGTERILDVTQESLAAIGYWPVPERREAAESSFDPAKVEAAADDTIAAVPEPAGEPADEDAIAQAGGAMAAAAAADAGAEDGDDWVEIEEQVEEEVAVDSAGDDGFQAVSDEIDEDIREVFVEEFEEELDGLKTRMSTWKDDPSELSDLKEIRRTFHTLKGSGRLVGAIRVGELSWSVENMLNRVLDESIEPGADVVALVGHAVAALPPLLAGLKGEHPDHAAPIGAITQTADKLAQGESARVEDIQSETRTVVRTVKRRVPRASLETPREDAAERAHAAEDESPVTSSDDMSAWPEVGASATESGDPQSQPDMPGLAASGPSEPGEVDPVTAESDADEAIEHAIAAPVLPPIDPVLLGILRSEVDQHVGVMRAFCDDNAATGDEPVRASESLLRSVHTLSGAVSMVDIPILMHVLAPLESYIKRLRAHANGFPPEGMAALSESIGIVDEVMQQFDHDEPQLPASDHLVQQLGELRDGLPEPPMAHPLFAEADVLEPDAETEAETEADTEIEAASDLEAVDITGASLAAAGDSDVSIDPAAAGETMDDDTPDWLRQEIEGAAAAVPGASGQTDEADKAADLAGEQDAAGFDAQAGSWLEMDSEPGIEPEAASESISEHEATADAGFETAPEPAARTDADTELEAEFEAEFGAESDTEFEATSGAALEGEGEADIEFEAEAGSDTDLEAGADVESDAVFGAEFDAPSSSEPEAESGTQPDADTVSGLAAESESGLQAPAGVEVEAEHEPPLEAQLDHGLTHEHKDEPQTESRDQADTESQPQPAAVAGLIRFPVDPQPDEALDLPDLDADLLEVFVEEANEILDEADSALVALHDNPRDHEPVAVLQRGLHTVKGGARMAGIAPIGDLGHSMESLLEALAEGRRDASVGVVQALEHGLDLLHNMVQRVRNDRAVAMPENAIAYFERLLEGDIASDDSPESEVDESTTRAAEAATATATGSTAREPAPRQVHAPQEMIRVRSDLLDSLVNSAGEVSIYRARLEEQIASFRFNLVEFDQTVTRLREQLRNMEIETEAQIIARYQREQEEAGEAGFDPLELDRFSQLQQYSRALAESVSDLVSIQGLLDDQTRKSETLLLQQSRVNSDLQEGLMRTRMVPFDSLVPGLRRTLRQAAQDTNKQARLKISGAQGEMDRNLLDRVKAPFEHMVRNAMAHGIEGPAERQRAGKPEEGTVSLDVDRDATEVVIIVSDDGGGIDLEAVRATAIDRGLMNADAQLSRRDIYAFMLETGFSTVSEVTKLAGRGVGLDVVASEIKQLGGSLSIDSEEGHGTSFTIRLPFTLAVTQAILISLGDQTFAVPMTSVKGVARIAGDDLRRRLEDPDSAYVYADESYRLYDLAGLLDVSAAHLTDGMQVPMLMTRTGDQRAAMRIDRVIGSREIVVKPVGPQLSTVPGIFGATIMGDGSVVMILDPAPLVRRHLALREDREELEADEPAELEGAAPELVRERPLVMVVDDSITMRKVTTRTLERNELDILTAKDGLDAVEKLQEDVPDLMLLDIEMPRMDGYELATYMRNDERLKDVPIIMITSRSGKKHREQAMALGVKRYLGKPYQEADLMSNVKEVLADRV